MSTITNTTTPATKSFRYPETENAALYVVYTHSGPLDYLVTECIRYNHLKVLSFLIDKHGSALIKHRPAMLALYSESNDALRVLMDAGLWTNDLLAEARNIDSPLVEYLEDYTSHDKYSTPSDADMSTPTSLSVAYPPTTPPSPPAKPSQPSPPPGSPGQDMSELIKDLNVLLDSIDIE